MTHNRLRVGGQANVELKAVAALLNGQFEGSYRIFHYARRGARASVTQEEGKVRHALRLYRSRLCKTLGSCRTITSSKPFGPCGISFLVPESREGKALLWP